MTASMTNLRKMSMLLAIAATLVTAPALILTPQLALAQQGKVVEGRGTGQVNCPPSGTSPPGDETMIFRGVKNRGTLGGFFDIVSEEGGEKFGFITGGHIGGK
jgi:hypothetical protein